jgi:hypothetical protein
LCERTSTSELVGTCSRYEDVKERVVYPALERLVGDEGELEQGEDDRQAVREALLAIRKQTLHVKPAYVHLDDPDFEDTLNRLVELIHGHVEHEDGILFPALAALSAEERESLRRPRQHVPEPTEAPSRSGDRGRDREARARIG